MIIILVVMAVVRMILIVNIINIHSSNNSNTSNNERPVLILVRARIIVTRIIRPGDPQGKS